MEPNPVKFNMQGRAEMTTMSDERLGLLTMCEGGQSGFEVEAFYV